MCASISFTCVASAHTYHVGTIITNVLIQFNFVLQLAKENGSDPVCQFWNFTEDSKYTGHQMSDISMALLLQPKFISVNEAGIVHYYSKYIPTECTY